MWTMCREEDLPTYFQRYPSLLAHKDSIILNRAYGNVFLPRYFYWNYYSPELNLHIDPNFKPKFCDMEFRGELRDDQPQLVQPFVSRVKMQHNGGVLKARPGAGKTVMGVYVACETKSKTLIIIDNNNLVDQWRDSILKFTNLTEDDIGMIQGDTLELDKPFVIAMVQTFMRRSSGEVLKDYYELIRDAGFNLVWYDECHKTSSGPRYATASLLLNTYNVNGLSATPYNDGLHQILMDNTIGEIVSDSKNYDIRPEVHIVKYVSGIGDKLHRFKNGKTIPYKTYVKRAGDLLRQRSRFNKLIIESRRYHEVVKLINEAELQDNQRIINIVFTTDQVKSISEYLDNSGISNIQFYSKQKKLDKETDNVLVATYSYAGTGFDFKQLSVCVIATPLTGRKSLIQVIGRVLRSCEGKQTAKAYILIDLDFGDMFTKDIDSICRKLTDEFNCDIKIHEVY